MSENMLLQQLPIGVFDSGMGGLTVLSALRNTLPQESFIYLGDTARLPYGTKSPETVKQYAEQMAAILVEQRIKALVIACNTATTAALTHLQQRLHYMPVIGVVEPGAKAAIDACQQGSISLLATETTVASKAYQTIISQQLPHTRIKAIPCGLLVALAEEGLTDHAITRETLRYYLTDISEDETILLGCTHFPVFKNAIQEMLPSTIKIVDSAQATAQVVKQKLNEKGLMQGEDHQGQVSYLVTDSIDRFKRVGAIFLHHSLDDKPVTLIDTPCSTA
ncbi:glutamate racemase [Legionella sp. W05-934-2]|jgi:glutamate racemase|uniref:glutamate racemase n=1 Tax=Legionella sp. W05-934-2 TaxID=1198649 RepID=UPI0034617BC3